MSELPDDELPDDELPDHELPDHDLPDHELEVLEDDETVPPRPEEVIADASREPLEPRS
jgi:hypothetical protein